MKIGSHLNFKDGEYNFDTIDSNHFRLKTNELFNSDSLNNKVSEETMYVDHYSGTFYSLITRYKRKYLLLSED